jgi:hypothetical protein
VQRHAAGAALFVAAIFCETRSDAQSPPSAPETIAVGDWQLSPTLQLRTRGEYRRDPLDMGGRDASGTTERVRNAYLIFERARVGLGAEHGALRAQITLQDSRQWGPFNAYGFFAPHEAFAEVHTQSARPAFLRIGRQVVTWGEGRLLGAADWHPVSRSLDALRGRVALGPFDLEALAAVVESPQPASPSFGPSSGPTFTGTQLYGANLAWPIDPLFNVEVTSLARVARSGIGESRFATAARSGETYVQSVRASGEGRGWKYGVDGAYEFGRVSAAILPGGLTRASYAAAAHVSRTFDSIGISPTVRVGGSYASGQGAGSGTTYTQFDPILPDVHTHYGLMDALSWSNIIEGNARVTVVPFTDTTLGFQYRYARLADASGEWLNAYLALVGRASAGSDATLGHEFDVMATWRPWAPFDIAAGYAAFLMGDGARAIMVAEGRGAPSGDGSFSPAAVSHFGYLQATLAVP